MGNTDRYIALAGMGVCPVMVGPEKLYGKGLFADRAVDCCARACRDAEALFQDR
jgi:hypothetical protein